MPTPRAREDAGQSRSRAPGRRSPPHKSCFLDYRRSVEVIVFIDAHIPGRDPDSQRQSLLTLASGRLDRLLHCDCAGESIGRTAEGDHQAVAEALDLATLPGLDWSAEQIEMRGLNLFEALVTQTGKCLGGGDRVGKQDCQRFLHGF